MKKCELLVARPRPTAATVEIEAAGESVRALFAADSMSPGVLSGLRTIDETGEGKFKVLSSGGVTSEDW